MRVRSVLLSFAFGAIALGCVALVSLRSTCRNSSRPGQISDLPSLLNLLHEWERQEVDPQAAQAVARVASELEQAIVAEREAKSHLPSAAAPPPAVAPAESEKDAFYALAIAGQQCHVAYNMELWGEPVVWGNIHRTQNAAECCAACQAHQATAKRGGLDSGPNSTMCNTWVFCGDRARCGGRYQECWLKRQATLPPAGQPSSNGVAAWTSGVVYDGDTWLAAYDKRNTLTLQFDLGQVVVELLPALAPASVRELKRLATMLASGSRRCEGCKLYRAETNFLVQGVISHPGGYVGTPRNPNPPQKSLMERGLVCWAGGAGGPDFFVNLIDQAGFGDSHLCWGLIRDMALMDAIVKRPTRPKARPNDMTFLAEELRFNITLG